MLLESLVKATVELQGFRVVTVTGDARGLVAELAPDLRYAPRCGQCGDRGGYRDTRRVRHFRHVPLWGIPVALRYAPRRVRCSRCDGVHVEAMPWVSGTQQLTRALLVTLATWARALPWQQVARLFRCSWGTVATAVEAAVAYGLAHRDLDDVTHIGIDEISRKRGHVYVTNVDDLVRKRLVWSGEGRSTETVDAFFDVLGPEKTAALEGVCCDMWQPYIDVIKARAPQAVLVFDKFHIVRHLMAAVDQVRRDEVREKGPAHKALLYKTRFIWLKNPVESHRAPSPAPRRPRTTQSQDQPRLSPQRALPRLLGVPAGGLGEAVSEAVVLVGDAFPAPAAARLRVAGAAPRRRHPQLCPDADRQRHRRRTQQ